MSESNISKRKTFSDFIQGLGLIALISLAFMGISMFVTSFVYKADSSLWRLTGLHALVAAVLSILIFAMLSNNEHVFLLSIVIAIAITGISVVYSLFHFEKEDTLYIQKIIYTGLNALIPALLSTPSFFFMHKKNAKKNKSESA